MLAAALLVLGIALGALITMATYATELRRIARFLQTREPRSNAPRHHRGGRTWHPRPRRRREHRARSLLTGASRRAASPR